jgi:hypothetical protein
MAYDGISHLRVASDSDHAELLAAGIAQVTQAKAWLIEHHRDDATPLWVACSSPSGSGLPVIQAIPLLPAEVPAVLSWHAERLAKLAADRAAGGTADV